MSYSYLCTLMDGNAQLRNKVYNRITLVEYELDRLRALRAGLVLAVAPPRKRRRKSEQLIHAFSLVDQKIPKVQHNPMFVAALKAEVQRRRGNNASFTLTKRDWESVAASLLSTEHRPSTPYELLTAFKALHCTTARFTTAEVNELCQLVRKNGYNWPIVCATLRQHFTHERQPFEVAKQYRFCLRSAFNQKQLTSSQLIELLNSEAISAQRRDYDQLSVEANRFTTNRAFQVDPRYLQRKIEDLAFKRYVPACYHLFWKIVNLISPLRLWYPYRLDYFHHSMPLCYQQLSLDDLSRYHQCTTEELKKRVIEYLQNQSRSPEKLSFKDGSEALFGTASAARVLFEVAEELHTPRV